MELARLYVAFDAFGRLPKPFSVFFTSSGRLEKITSSTHQATTEVEFRIDDSMLELSDISELRDVLKHHVVAELKRRGEWRSAFRKRLMDQWRVAA
jgi:hypothetical protein